MMMYYPTAQTKQKKNKKEECFCSSPMQIQDHTTEGKQPQIINYMYKKSLCFLIGL